MKGLAGYGLVTALVVSVAVGTLGVVGHAVYSMLQAVAAALQAAGAA